MLNTQLHVEWTKYIKQAHVQTDVVLVPDYTSLLELTGMVSHAAETLYMYVLTPQNIFLITLVLQNAVCFVADNYFLFKAFLHIYIYMVALFLSS